MALSSQPPLTSRTGWSGSVVEVIGPLPVICFTGGKRLGGQGGLYYRSAPGSHVD